MRSVNHSLKQFDIRQLPLVVLRPLRAAEHSYAQSVSAFEIDDFADDFVEVSWGEVGVSEMVSVLVWE